VGEGWWECGERGRWKDGGLEGEGRSEGGRGKGGGGKWETKGTGRQKCGMRYVGERDEGGGGGKSRSGGGEEQGAWQRTGSQECGVRHGGEGDEEIAGLWCGSESELGVRNKNRKETAGGINRKLACKERAGRGFERIECQHPLERVKPVCGAVKSEVRALEAEVQLEVESAVNALESEVHSLGSEGPVCAALKSEVRALKSEVHALESEVHACATLKCEARAFKSEVHALDSEVRALKSEVHALKSEAHALESETHVLDSEVRVLLTANAQLEYANEQLTSLIEARGQCTDTQPLAQQQDLAHANEIACFRASLSRHVQGAHIEMRLHVRAAMSGM
jgi:hypothetical protein